MLEVVISRNYCVLRHTRLIQEWIIRSCVIKRDVTRERQHFNDLLKPLPIELTSPVFASFFEKKPWSVCITSAINQARKHFFDCQTDLDILIVPLIHLIYDISFPWFILHRHIVHLAFTWIHLISPGFTWFHPATFVLTTASVLLSNTSRWRPPLAMDTALVSKTTNLIRWTLLACRRKTSCHFALANKKTSRKNIGRLKEKESGCRKERRTVPAARTHRCLYETQSQT